jgi:hypothetical protein
MMHSQFHIYGNIEEPTRTGIGTRVVRRMDGRWRRWLCKTRTCAPVDATEGRGTGSSLQTHCSRIAEQLRTIHVRMSVR